ncbi:hypothetical protein Sru01_20150 [Sphaerisporangium rufum]|uniref:Uncharacterized protein n=1 Tax=Sphaerisporangium rufum TaxID=1381558 RepID=A0A919R127_9ACTN|nr:hypothetical protein [Sphaerisporangium rufum]GII77033.1 hypothetical protein Sru01_20150 [Sphaerisporangium rufum]
MPPKSRQAERRPARPVTITAVVDPVAALASENLDDNLYLYDTNRIAGSSGFGTPALHSRVRKGDTLLWNVIPLECETFVALADIEIDPRIAEPTRKVYPGTDIVFWTAEVKQDLTEPALYRLSFLLGTVGTPFTPNARPALAGAAGEGKERR